MSTLRYSLILLTVALFLYVAIWPRVWQNRADQRRRPPVGYVMPSAFYRVFSLDNQGMVANLLFLKGTQFYGGRYGGGWQLQDAGWRYVFSVLDTVTDLDPHFVDPYVFTEGMLAWEAGRPSEANRLLKKGLKARKSDWRIPYYIGFNLFYFDGDFKNAHTYLMQASRLPGSPSYLKNLAARIAYYGGDSKAALIFLQEMIRTTSHAGVRHQMQKRFDALSAAASIEEAISRYREEVGRDVNNLEELVKQGYLESLPSEPYGGTWVLTESGRVFSTSRFSHRGAKSRDGS